MAFQCFSLCLMLKLENHIFKHPQAAHEVLAASEVIIQWIAAVTGRTPAEIMLNHLLSTCQTTNQTWIG